MKQKHDTRKSEPTKSSTIRLVVVGGLVIGAAGTLVALAASTGDLPTTTTTNQPAAPVSSPPVTGGQVPAPPGITNPRPYQYDAATDRHYDPDHAHWHSGPPPR